MAGPDGNDVTTVVGRIGAVADGTVELVVRDRGGLAVRRIPLPELRKAVVQVEFSPRPPRSWH